MREVDEQLRELYTLLHTRPWNEVLEILRRIRENPDPLAVVRFIKEGDILVRGNERRKCTNASADAQGPEGEEPSPVQPRLLPTRSWTTIADDNVVQDLVSVFFEREQPFLMSFVDREMFLADMQAKFDPPAGRPFCSTLLVNAICAVTAVGICPLAIGTDRSADGEWHSVIMKLALGQITPRGVIWARRSSPSRRDCSNCSVGSRQYPPHRRCSSCSRIPAGWGKTVQGTYSEPQVTKC